MRTVKLEVKFRGEIHTSYHEVKDIKQTNKAIFLTTPGRVIRVPKETLHNWEMKNE